MVRYGRTRNRTSRTCTAAASFVHEKRACSWTGVAIVDEMGSGRLRRCDQRGQASWISLAGTESPSCLARFGYQLQLLFVARNRCKHGKFCAHESSKRLGPFDRCAEYEPEHRGREHERQSHLRVTRARKNGCLPAVTWRGFAREGNACCPQNHDDFAPGGISCPSRVLRVRMELAGNRGSIRRGLPLRHSMRGGLTCLRSVFAGRAHAARESSKPSG
jgi:hypothetical protein